MSRFDDCMSFVRQAEGGSSADPEDRGGATKWGVIQKTYDAWRLHGNLPTRPVFEMTEDEARSIYRTEYWQPVGAGSVEPPIDLVLFDGAVNSGVSESIRWLQRVIHARDDGVFGPVTRSYLDDALGSMSARQIALNMLEERRKTLRQIAENDPSQRRFLNGWLNRVLTLQIAVSSYNPSSSTGGAS